MAWLSAICSLIAPFAQMFTKATGCSYVQEGPKSNIFNWTNFEGGRSIPQARQYLTRMLGRTFAPQVP